MDTPDISRRDTIRRVGALTAISFLLLVGIEGIGNRVLTAVGRWNLVIVFGILVCFLALARRGGRGAAREVREPEEHGSTYGELPR